MFIKSKHMARQLNSWPPFWRNAGRGSETETHMRVFTASSFVTDKHWKQLGLSSNGRMTYSVRTVGRDVATPRDRPPTAAGARGGLAGSPEKCAPWKELAPQGPHCAIPLTPCCPNGKSQGLGAGVRGLAVGSGRPPRCGTGRCPTTRAWAPAVTQHRRLRDASRGRRNGTAPRCSP